MLSICLYMIRNVSKILFIYIFSVTSYAEEVLTGLVQKIAPSVLSISVENKNGDLLSGTGFFVDSSGVVATNFHVIQNAGRVTAKLSNGVTIYCKGVLTLDQKKDLALLQFSGKDFPALSLASPENIKQGESIAIIGSPLGLEQTISNGIVSAKRYEDEWEQIQFTAPISRGSSGSPVVDMQGNVIGVATFIRTNGQSLNFATSVKHLLPLVSAIKNLEPVSFSEALPESIDQKKSVQKKVDVDTEDNNEDEKIINRLSDKLKVFWNGYWSATQKSDAQNFASYFAVLSDYQYKKSGYATREEIASSALDLYVKFPKRKYLLKDYPKLVKIKGKPSMMGFDFSYVYEYWSGNKKFSGVAYVELALEYMDDEWQICKFREKVVTFK